MMKKKVMMDKKKPMEFSKEQRRIIFQGHIEKEEIMLNGPKMAEGYAYFGFGRRSVSPDNKLLSYGIDTISRRQYTIYFKNLESGELLADKLENTTGGTTWANDNKTIFYTKKDQVTLRAHQIYKHKLGDNQDDLLFEEGDTTFGVTVYKTKSRRYIIIACYSTLTNEFYILNADTPDANFKIFQSKKSVLTFPNHITYFLEQSR